jgi:exonuclease I
MNLNDFSLCYDIDEKYRMYVFNVPDIHRHSYEMFKKSKFSKLNETYKEKILRFHKQNTTSKIAQVLYKIEEGFLELEDRLKVKIPREQELGSLLDYQIEIFDASKMIKNVTKKEKQIWD